MTPTLRILCALLIGAAVVDCSKALFKEESILDCLREEDSVDCARVRIDKEIDEIETQTTGRKSETPMSRVIEEAGGFLKEGLETIFGNGEGTEEVTEDDEGQKESRGNEEARKKKIGKKKKKALQKLLMLAMLLKAKIGVILQLITTHFQIKFFVLAIISLILNAASFWLDLKKSHQPSKVIYYEHAQHQHHYDHEDEHAGYWGRSSYDHPEDQAYNAYAPEH